MRLADTELIIEVEKDFAVYGDEITFGGGKVIRDGMGQSARATSAEGVLDLVITNALILDHWGIVKADIGLKDGRIWRIGKAGNPDIQPGVDIPIGAGTEIIAGEGKIVTAGGIDAHIHFICPQQIEHARLFEFTPELRQHFQAECEARLDRIQRLRLKPNHRPGTFKFYYDLLFDYPFGGVEVENMQSMMDFITRRYPGVRPTKTPQEMVEWLREFHTALAQCLSDKRPVLDMIPG